MIKKIFTTLALCLYVGFISAQTPSFDNEQYQKALWMTARFYGAQRMGDGVNWLVATHEPTQLANGMGFSSSSFVKGKSYLKDADGNYDLTGGWFDCGDFVLFGQTFFYSAYMLLLGYSEFPEGYDDYYSFDYHGYIEADDYTWEGKKGVPNGIPDILDEAKYATDYIIKAFKDKNTFYYQKGNGSDDHKTWCTSTVKSATPTANGGNSDGSRPIYKATGGDGTSMAALGGAALAVMARVYAKFDPEYAQLCLEKALVAYEYVQGTKRNIDSGFYPAKEKIESDLSILYSELYRATKDKKYLDESLEAASFMNDPKGWNHNYSLNYNNTEDLCYYLLAACGSEVAKERLQYYVETLYKPTSGYFLNVKNGNWGILRFPANQAFVYGLYDKLIGAKELNPYALTSVEYIMGKNGRNFSYIVGFGESHPYYPHHRNFYRYDGNSEANLPKLDKSYKFLQLGYMVGGSINNGAYDDNELEYTYSEGGIDYNAGLVGALGYINSLLNPVNTNKFGHPTPNLGDDASICGVEKIVLESGITPAGNMTFNWYKDGTKIESSKTASSLTVTSKGVYTCEVDSAGEWITSDEINILGEEKYTLEETSATLCDPASIVLGLEELKGASAQFVWYKDGAVIKGANESTYEATSAGLYECEMTALNCDAVKIVSADVKSKLPNVIVKGPDADGNVTLMVDIDGSNDFEWYDVAEGGEPIGTGTTYKTKIDADKTFYVQNAGSSSSVVGPEGFSGEGVNWGKIGAKFTVSKPMQINAITALLTNINTNEERALVAELEHNGVKVTFKSDMTKLSGNKLKFTFSNPIEVSEAGDYTLTCGGDAFDIAFYQSGEPYSTYAGNGDVITFTGATNGTASNNPFPGLIDWEITTGSGCARAVVKVTKSNVTAVETISNDAIAFYPNPVKDQLTVDLSAISIGTQCSLEVISVLGVTEIKEILVAGSVNSINVSGLVAGPYMLKLNYGNDSQSKVILKAK